MQNERLLTRLLNARAREARLPLSGTFELSPVCNLACKMCYVRKTPAEVAAHHRPQLTLAQWMALGDAAREAGTLFLLLTGGEPFLWPHFRRLYEHLAGLGFVLSINSNATLISDETCTWLRQTPPMRLNLTLYGASDETYERLCGAKGMFTRVRENIDRLVSAGLPLKLNISLTPENIGDLEALVAFARERDLLLDASTYMFPPVRRDAAAVGQGARFTPEEAALHALEFQRLSKPDELYRAYLTHAAQGVVPPPGLDSSCIDPIDGQIRCQAGRAAYWITWDGYMTPCGMMSQPHADVCAAGFAGAWEQTVKSADAMRLSGLCEQCQSRSLCHCCAAMAQAETGSPSGIPQYLCRMAEATRTLAQRRLTQEALVGPAH